MATNYKPLNIKDHKDLKLKPVTTFSHIKDQHMAPVALHEFVKCATSLPVIFVKPSEDQPYQAVAMLGLKPGENLVIHEGTWNAVYMPSCIQIYPFQIARTSKENDQHTIIVDENADNISTTEGDALFDDEGKGTEFMDRCQQQIEKHFQEITESRAAIEYLAELDLIKSQDLTITVPNIEDKIVISGISIIDEEKMNALSTEKFEELRKRGLLPALYAQLASMHQMHRLTQMMEKTQAA